MDELHPRRASDIDVVARVASERRVAEGRPWLVMNMITSVDGATAVDGRSGGLGGPADRTMFGALRGRADIVLVAAGTARAENYGPPAVDETLRGQRRARGQDPVPRLALVTRSLNLDPESRMFRGGDRMPLVYAVRAAPPESRESLASVAEVVDAGETTVDLAAVVADLGRRGAAIVLVEGGPSLNGQLLSADLVDEICWSIAPVAVVGDSPRLAHGASGQPVGFALDRLFSGDGMLFARYVRTRGTPPSGGRSG